MIAYFSKCCNPYEISVVYTGYDQIYDIFLQFEYRSRAQIKYDSRLRFDFFNGNDYGNYEDFEQLGKRYLTLWMKSDESSEQFINRVSLIADSLPDLPIPSVPQYCYSANNCEPNNYDSAVKRMEFDPPPPSTNYYDYSYIYYEKNDLRRIYSDTYRGDKKRWLPMLWLNRSTCLQSKI